MLHRIEVSSKIVDDSVSARVLAGLKELAPVKDAKVVRVLTIKKDFSQQDLEKIGEAVQNPVVESFSLQATEIEGFDFALEIGFLPGVTDNVAHTAKELIEDLLDCKFSEEEAVASSTMYLLKGELAEADLEKIAYSLHNELIQYKMLKDAAKYGADGGMDKIVPTVKLAADQAAVTEVNLDVSDEELTAIGKKGVPNGDGTHRGPLALSLKQLNVIKDYFAKEGRQPTDIELESIAQTWSEHCKHTIFASPIDEIAGGLYKSYIKKATQDVRAAKGADDFCVSVFKDNSGAIKFNDRYYVTDKAETHNSPSALDPFGGSITGIVGVNRDTLGFGLAAKPIVNRYGFCFGDPRDEKPLYRAQNQGNKMLPPDRIADGVIAGVEAGGNQSGIPAPQGYVYYNERYKGKPLVFVGTIGLIPHQVAGQDSTEKAAQPGDLVVVIGGRVGQDGIHGATFSSESLDEGSPSTAVQIGDPITQKRLSDAILTEARDEGLYTSITDNGAGGISCSIAEMAKECGGCEVELDKVPLKYPNLEPWKIWISESQERMTLAVPEANWPRFKEIMDKHRVEATVVGKYTDSGRCQVNFHGETIMDLEMEFLHDGVPLWDIKTEAYDYQLTEVNVPAPADLGAELTEMVGRLNCASFAGISTMFDHEVQGMSIVKPLQGLGKVNGSATVHKPDYEDWKGVVASQAVNPLYSDISTYHMAASAIDTAVRNAVAVGGDPDYMALMDNFCWCSSNDADRLGQLKDAVRACYDYAVAYGAPYISGKDSMYNDFKGYDADNNPVKISVPPTLLISSMGVIPDVRKALTLDSKVAGDLVYVLGTTKKELGGSEYYYSKDETGTEVPQVDAEKALGLYRAFYQAGQKGLVASAISVAIGGLGVAFAKMAMAGKLGLKLDLGKVLAEGVQRDDELLFSETQSRLVVTVNPALKEEFEAAMAGQDFALVGEVTAEANVQMLGMNGEEVMNVSLDQLADSYYAANKFY